MADAIQAPQDASPESQAILKELEGEGHNIAGKEPTAEKPVEEPKPKAEEPKPEEKPEPKGDEPDEPAKPSKIEREPKYVPVGKHNEERHKRQEAEARAEKAEREAAEARAALENASGKPKQDNLEAKAKRLAEKHGIDEELAKDLLAEASPNPSLPPELESDIRAIKEQKALIEREALAMKQEKAFDAEFAGILKEFPDLADRKEDLKQLAFSEENINTSLRRIALEYRHDNQLDKAGKKSAEAPGGGKDSKSDVIDFENVTEDEFKNLSYEQLDQFEEWRKKHGKK